MRYLKTYEHLVNYFEDKAIYGEYLTGEMELIKGLNGFITYDFFYKDDYNVANHPNEVQYLFLFK